MSAWIIYGKIIKTMPLQNNNGGSKIVEPQKTFRALNYKGQRVTRLADAGKYYEKEMAQKIIDKAQAYWDKQGYGDCVAYEIRKSK